MGAVGSADHELSLANVSVQQRLVLTDAQRGCIEEELYQMGATPHRVSAKGSDEPDESPITHQGCWLVFYDNPAFALTMRDWWLSERAGKWLLRVPLLKPGGAAGLITSGYEELTVIEEILERVGLVQHAEALRKGIVSNVEKLLAQAGVTPFARVYTQGCIYRLREKGDATEATSDETDGLILALHNMKLDVKFAEDVAISSLLFSKGVAARESLNVSLAEFLLPGGKDANCSAAEHETMTKLSAGGFEFPVASQAPCPEAVAYLQTLRPAHLRALRRAGVVPETVIS